MIEPLSAPPRAAQDACHVAIIHAEDYVNKLSGERLERACRTKLEAGVCALVISFKSTEVVNSIGISILLGIIEAAEKREAQVVFSSVNRHTIQLFELLGLTRHVTLADDEQTALAMLTEVATTATTAHRH